MLHFYLISIHSFDLIKFQFYNQKNIPIELKQQKCRYDDQNARLVKRLKKCSFS